MDTNTWTPEKEKALRIAFDKIKKELNEHLETINENTSEIDSNYEYLKRLETRIDKLSERLEDLELFLCEKKKKDFSKTEKLPKIILTRHEQEVFLLLYTATSHLTYTEIAKKLGFTITLVADYLTNIIEKGVPIIKKYVDKEPRVLLDPSFRELQAKQNIIPLNKTIAQEHTE